MKKTTRRFERHPQNSAGDPGVPKPTNQTRDRNSIIRIIIRKTGDGDITAPSSVHPSALSSTALSPASAASTASAGRAIAARACRRPRASRAGAGGAAISARTTGAASRSIGPRWGGVDWMGCRRDWCPAGRHTGSSGKELNPAPRKGQQKKK
jgi:hypothetical protein